jgi:putative hydrolase
MNAYVGAFEPDGIGIEDRLTAFDPTDLAALQETFSNPDVLFGEMESPAQAELKIPLRTLLAAIVGYVDFIMDTVGRRIIGSYGPLTEALRRRRLEEAQGTGFVARLLGVELSGTDYERGASFMRGVVERAGEEGLARLWRSARELPTPAELQAPGLWLARIDLPEADQQDPPDQQD